MWAGCSTDIALLKELGGWWFIWTFLLTNHPSPIGAACVLAMPLQEEL
jgi:hypothetical protein